MGVETEAVSLGTVNIVSDIAGTQVTFPVDLTLSLSTSPDGVKLNVLADVGMGGLQAQFDAIAKTFPMPNDTSGYGTKFVAQVESANLSASGDTAVVSANVNVQVWQIEKGIPLVGTTIGTRTDCTTVLGKRICWSVPVRIEARPGDDIKTKIEEGFTGRIALSLATPDGQSIEVRPSPPSVQPRGDIGKWLNNLAGIFDANLSSLAQKELSEIISDGTLRKALPDEIEAYNPVINAVQFTTRPDGSLGAKVDFQAMLTQAQLTELIQKSVGKIAQ